MSGFEGAPRAAARSLRAVRLGNTRARDRGRRGTADAGRGGMQRTIRTCAPLLVLSLAAILGCETSTDAGTSSNPDIGDEACSDSDRAICVIASDKQRISSPDV